MKYVGCVAEYARQRAADLLNTYRTHIAQCETITPAVYTDVVRAEAPRFYVSAERAAAVISRMDKGLSNKHMRPIRQQMFQEIYQRFTALRQQRPQLTTLQIIITVLQQKAPQFYISPGRAKAIILKEKKIWHKEHIRRLRQL